MVFYGVHDPAAARDEQPVSPTIFEEMRDALSMMRNRKEARMRPFNTRTEAEEYSRLGYSVSLTTPSSANAGAPKLQQQDPPEQLALQTTQTTTTTTVESTHSNGSETAAERIGAAEPPAIVFIVPKSPTSKAALNGNSNAAAAAGNEKPAYRGPKSQELVQFRKLIEQGKYEQVRDTVWRNPRYLIGSGDTPALLKESCRYNALHVAALANNARMCELLLDIIGDPKFIQLLYGKKNAHHCAETSGILQDLYLNMPERGRNETPLHLAAKFGSLEVVDVLTSYAQCSSRPNSDGKLPIEIVCSRAERDWSFVKQIKELLSGRFYVPVIRSVDNTLPPMIGEPFSPRNPPKLQFDPLSPEMEIQAYAGPMNREEAHTFRRRWKTPPRIAGSHDSPSRSSSPFGGLFSTSAAQSTASSPPSQPSALRFTPAKMSTPERTLTTSRQLFTNGGGSPANGHKSRTSSVTIESTIATTDDDSPEDDIDAAAAAAAHQLANSSLTGDDVNDDLDSPPHHLQPTSPLPNPATPFRFYRCAKPMLDDSLLNTSSGSNASAGGCDSPMFRERHAKLCDSEKGLEVIGRELAAQRRVKWREYWPFLDSFVDIRSADGLAAFEERLAANAETKRLESEAAARAVAAAAAAAAITATSSSMTFADGSSNALTLMSSAAASLKETGISLLCKALNQLEVKGAFSADGQLPFAPPHGAPVAVLSPPVLVHQAASGGQHRRIVQQTQPAQPNAFSAYLCAEKSWQVYAKRVTDGLRTSAATTTTAAVTPPALRDQLLGELRRLRSLVCSYQEDERFTSVDFGQAHSRFAHLIVAGLMQNNAASAAAAIEDSVDLQRLRGEFQQAHDTVAATNVPSNVTCSADEDLQCVLANVLHYMTAPGSQRVGQARSAGLTEGGARALWKAEERCRCTWSGAELAEVNVGGGGGGTVGGGRTQRQQQQQQRHLKRMSQRMDQQQQQQQQQLSAQLMDMEVDDQHQQQQQAKRLVPNRNNAPMNGWQSRPLRSMTLDSDDDDEGDENDYFFDSDSEDDVYLTPPETMSTCSPADGKMMACSAYDNYSMGEEPTKTDVDVLNALSDVELTVAQYPHICQWRDAMHRFTMLERNTFASITPVRLEGVNRCRTNAKMPNAALSEWSLLRRMQVDRLFRFGGQRRQTMVADDDDDVAEDGDDDADIADNSSISGREPSEA